MNILMFLSKPFITDSRVRKEASSLVNNGHKVTVITWDRNNQYADQESIDNVNVIRIKNKGFLRVLPGMLIKNPLWWLKAFVRGLKCDFDVVHCHDLDTLPVGILIKKKTKCKLVYDAHEIFAYMIKKDVSTIIYKLTLALEKFLIKYVDDIITVNKMLKLYFHSISIRRTTIVMNCSNPICRYKKPKNDIFTVCYIGSLSKERGFPELVDTFGFMNNVKFIVAGKKESLYESVKERCKLYKNTEFLGTIKIDDIYSTMIKSNASICMMTPGNKNDEVSTPIKIFDAMAVGRPSIVTKGMHYSDIVNDNKCGILAEYNSKGIGKAVNSLYDKKIQEELGKNGLMVARSKYNWELQEKNLLKVYQ